MKINRSLCGQIYNLPAQYLTISHNNTEVITVILYAFKEYIVFYLLRLISFKPEQPCKTLYFASLYVQPTASWFVTGGYYFNLMSFRIKELFQHSCRYIRCTVK